jgi:TonB-linked SusC/RagA family outer membrane protein
MRKIASLLTVLLCSTAFVFAQSKVNGKVTDANGSPLSAISVRVSGTDAGTSTGPDGSFSIDIGKNSATLQFSGVGYLNKTMKVSTGQTVSVSLEKDTRNLSEVVVTALGIKREKRSLGYATQTVGSEQLSKSGTGNTFSELSGKVAGLTVTNSSGDPGAGTYIQLRGATTITGQNQPLIVVDGIPLDNSNNNYDPSNAGFQAGGPNADLTGGATATNRGLDINPNDIESITVLKGPAATALYGSQATAGALIITTKKGVSGKRGASVSLNSSVTFDKVGRLPALQNKFGQGTGGVYQGPDNPAHSGTSWGAAIDTLFWNGDATYAYDKHGAIVGKSDPSAKTPVTPYNQYDFFQTGVTFDNNVSLSGATDKGGYRMSLGNIDQTGIIPLSKYLKSTFSINGNSKLTDKLSVSGGITYVNSINNKVLQGSNTSGVMLGLARTTPTFDNSNGLSDPAHNSASYELPDGTQRNYRGAGVGYDNPYWTVAKNPFGSDIDRVFGFGQANLDMFKWLTLSERIGGDIYTQADKQSYDVGSNTGFGTTGNIFLIDYGSREFNNNFSLNLHKTLNKDLSGSLILGHDYLFNLNTTRFVSGSGFALPGFLDISNTSSVQSSEAEVHKATQAFFGDLELNYKNMLYLGLTGREENTSTLPEDKNSYFFPSASLGWVFTELKSLKNGNVLSFGKLRATYAQTATGTAAYSTTTPFGAASFKDGFTSGITFPISGVPGYQISSAITTIGNASLAPERGKSYELGADLTFFKGRIGLNATYYETKTTDVIYQSSVSYTTGFAGKILNGAVLDNKGVELSLNTTPISTESGLRWDLNFNWAHNKNLVVQLPGGIPYFLGGFGGGEAGTFAIQGQPFGVIYGSVTPHTVLTDLKSPLLINDAPGDPGQFQPLAGGVGPNLVIGDPNPQWVGAVISNLTYKGITFGFQIDVKHGGDLWNGTRGALANKGTAEETSNRGQAVTFKGLLGHLDANNNVVHFAADGVTEIAGPGAANTTSSIYTQYYWQNIGNSFGGGQETDIEDGSYTKLRQISLTYDLPKSFVTRAHFTGLSLTIFANNIYTWTKYDGIDPESNLAGASSIQGLDYFNNPTTKSYGIRLNIGL